MEGRLLEAARKGNIEELNDLIKSNGLVLEEMALEGAGQTPLHIACVAGHMDFVRELLKLKPKFTEKVNADGFSLLHITAARGDVEIARELLRVGQHLSSVKGRERRIPLHYAIVNGELDVLKVLLSTLLESIEETTAREEMVLHLAMKNNRFDAVVVLVEHLKQHKKSTPSIEKTTKATLSCILLPPSKILRQVVNLMLCGFALECGIVEVNALNRSSSTPLDVSSRSDREIREILMRAGAKHGQSNLHSSQRDLVHRDEDNNNGITSSQRLSTPKDSNQGQESLDDERNDTLVVAVLIASATFQAVIQPPTLLKKTEIHSKNGFLAACSSFATSPISKQFALGFFLSSNTFGFLLSVRMIIHLTKKLPLRWPLVLSTFAMVFTYLTCMANVPSRSLLDEDFSPQGAILIFILATLIPVALVPLQNKIARSLEAVREHYSRPKS